MQHMNTAKHLRSLNPLFIPGPTNIPLRLQQAMQYWAADHRAPDFHEFIQPIYAGLLDIFNSKDATPIVITASGTGGWEAALTNLLSLGDKVAATNNGMFGQRWIEMCHGLQYRVQEVAGVWGDGASASAFAQALIDDANHDIKAVLVTHNETSTGVTSDVAAIRAALDSANHPALLLVDCISSLASIDVQMDEWGIDVVLGGSQKGFMLATGATVLGFSPKAMAAMEQAGSPRSFFDIKAMVAANNAGTFPFTPSIPLLAGLRESIAMLLEEGLENVYARHRFIATGVRAAIAAWSLQLCANHADVYSDTVSTVMVPDGFDSERVVLQAYEKYGVSYGAGLGQVAGKAFRIGHIGMMTATQALAGIATAEMAMVDVGIQIKLGSGITAAQQWYMQ